MSSPCSQRLACSHGRKPNPSTPHPSSCSKAFVLSQDAVSCSDKYMYTTPTTWTPRYVKQWPFGLYSKALPHYLIHMLGPRAGFLRSPAPPVLLGSPNSHGQPWLPSSQAPPKPSLKREDLQEIILNPKKSSLALNLYCSSKRARIRYRVGSPVPCSLTGLSVSTKSTASSAIYYQTKKRQKRGLPYTIRLTIILKRGSLFPFNTILKDNPVL